MVAAFMLSVGLEELSHGGLVTLEVIVCLCVCDLVLMFKFEFVFFVFGFGFMFMFLCLIFKSILVFLFKMN